MPVFPGDTLPTLKQVGFLGKDDCCSFRVETGMHVGTHMDAPSHMLEGGKGLAAYPAEHFIGKGIILDARGRESIDADLLENVGPLKDTIILIFTGFDEHFEEPKYYDSYPELTEAFAERLAAEGVKIVGMDTPSPDRHPYKIHKILLAKDVLIIENVCNLKELLSYSSFQVTALPTKFDAEAAPVRVVAEVL